MKKYYLLLLTTIFIIANSQAQSPAGYDLIICKSTDGINWTAASSGQFSGSGEGVTWNGSRWVAVGSGTNTILTSTDGDVWTAATGGFLVQGNGISSKNVWKTPSPSSLEEAFLRVSTAVSKISGVLL